MLLVISKSISLHMSEDSDANTVQILSHGPEEHAFVSIFLRKDFYYSLDYLILLVIQPNPVLFDRKGLLVSQL